MPLLEKAILERELVAVDRMTGKLTTCSTPDLQILDGICELARRFGVETLDLRSVIDVGLEERRNRLKTGLREHRNFELFEMERLRDEIAYGESQGEDVAAQRKELARLEATSRPVSK